MTGDLTTRLQTLEAGSDPATALAFYDSLPAATLDQMIGSWHGAGLPTGHIFDGLLEKFGWHGKRFEGTEDAHPLVFADSDEKLFSIDPSRVPLGMLIDHIELAGSSAASGLFRMSAKMLSTQKPQARLRMTEYCGVVTATMIYDALPINDVFRAVSPDVLVGAMDMRGFERPFLFTLRREAPVAA